MRITKEHINYMRTEMCKSSKTPSLSSYINKGLSEKRWRWDWCYATPGLSKWICDNIYPYANDDHLETALKFITQGYKND